MQDRRLEAEDVRPRPEAVNAADAGLGDDLCWPVRLAGVDVGMVYLDRFHARADDGVLERDARVRVRRRVEDHVVVVADRLLHLRHQFALVVGLVKHHLDAMPLAMFTNHILNVRQLHAAVNLRFALAQQV